MLSERSRTKIPTFAEAVTEEYLLRMDVAIAVRMSGKRTYERDGALAIQMESHK